MADAKSLRMKAARKALRPLKAVRNMVKEDEKAQKNRERMDLLERNRPLNV